LKRAPGPLAKSPLNWDDSYIQASFKLELNAELLKLGPWPFGWIVNYWVYSNTRFITYNTPRVIDTE
jgi:hypothetical protein